MRETFNPQRWAKRIWKENRSFWNLLGKSFIIAKCIWRNKENIITKNPPCYFTNIFLTNLGNCCQNIGCFINKRLSLEKNIKKKLLWFIKLRTHSWRLKNLFIAKFLFWVKRQKATWMKTLMSIVLARNNFSLTSCTPK